MVEVGHFVKQNNLSKRIVLTSPLPEPGANRTAWQTIRGQRASDYVEIGEP